MLQLSLALAVSMLFSFSLPVLGAPEGKGVEAQHAQELKDMKEHFKAGLTHYSLGEFAEAAADFREAYRIHAEPAILFNIAQTMRQMNDYHHAYFYYAQYLSQRPDASNRSEVEQLMSAMKRKMDDEDQMKAAQAVQAAAAPAAISSGNASADKVAVAGPAAKSGGSSSAEQVAAAPQIAVVAPPPVAAKSDTFWTAPHLGGVVAGGGAVALGAVALISHTSAVSSADKLNQEYQAGTLTAQDASVKSDVDSKGKLATIGAIGGAVLLVAGAVLVFAF